MILHTIVPLDIVLQGIEDYQPSYSEVEIAGVKMLVEQTGLDQGRIVRILSTNPEDYLNSSLQPGRIIKFIPGN